MKYLILILITISFSFFSNAQKENIIKKDSSKLVLNSFRLNYVQQTHNNNLFYSFNFNNSSRFTIYSNSFNSKNVLYDDYRNEYINNDALQPYSNFGSAIIGGYINYLIVLLEKKK